MAAAARAGRAVWRRGYGSATIERVEPLFEDRDLDSLMGGVFDINATLVEIRDELRAIRRLLENDDEEEEEADDS